MRGGRGGEGKDSGRVVGGTDDPGAHSSLFVRWKFLQCHHHHSPEGGLLTTTHFTELRPPEVEARSSQSCLLLIIFCLMFVWATSRAF